MAPVWSENLGLPEVQAGLDRVAIAADIPTLAKLMERALLTADGDVYAEALEALDQVYADPVQREVARSDLLRQIRKKTKRIAWSTPAATAEIREGVAQLLDALRRSNEVFAAYGEGARSAVLHDLEALEAALLRAETAGAGVRFEA